MWREEKIEKSLVGERIKQINISGDALFIKTNRGVHKYHVEGDCCSGSYFYEVSNVNQMLTWCAKEIEEIENMPDPDPESKYECLQAYGYKIHTEGGYGLIVFRNESNGYYGGWMEYDGLVPEEHIHGKKLTEDWNM